MLLRVGSRGSRLALTQATLAAERLRRPGVEVALVPITTAGDRDRTKPFGEIGARGVFVKEIEEALLGGRIDVAVHSAKDMTSTDTDGLAVGAYLEREDPRDALCGAAEIRPGMRIGTASVRRRAQLLALEPTLSVEPLRGNVDTRLRKRGERGLDAVVLAACGLDRLGLSREIGLRIDPEQMLPEAAQGALALQVRAGEEELVAAVDHAETRRRVEAERRLVSAGRRRLSRARRGPPRRLDADRARRGRGRRLDRAPLRRRPRSARPGARRLPAGVRIVVTRPREQASRARAGARGARPRGRRLPARRDRAARRRAGRRLRLRLGRRHERERRARAAPAHARHASAGGRDRRRDRRRRWAAPTSSPGSPRRRACSRSCRGRRGGCCSRAPRARGGCSSTSSGPSSFPLYRTRELRPERFPDADLVVLASASAARAYAAVGIETPALSIGPQTTAAARAAGVDVVGGGGDARPARSGRRGS